MQAAALVLAAITLALVIVALRLVVATRAELELLRRQLGAGHRPVLLDVPVTAPVPADMGAEDSHAGPTIETRLPGIGPRRIDPRRPFVAFEGQKVYLSVPLRNVGGGLAVLDGGGLALAGPMIGDLEYRALQRDHVPVGETARIDLVAAQAPDPDDKPDITWELTVPYSDPSGWWRTVAHVQIVCRDEDWLIERVEHESDHEPHREERPAPARTEPAARPVGVRGEPVVDLWGNPIQPRRRRR
jgi:hypothetical protein